MSELKIPDAAWHAAEAGANEIWKDYCDTHEAAIKAAAPLIVAAELRRLTDHIFSMSRQPMTTHELCTDIAQSYLKRADELDSQGVTK